jgi:hypothetical protein
VEFLISRGAQHHIFSAVAMNLADEVRRIVTADSAALNQRQSRNENHQTPLQFAVRMNRAAMVQLLLDLGADPLAVDGSGMPVAGYATTPDIDLPVMQKIAAMTTAEFERAAIDRRPPNPTAVHLLAAVALRAWDTASAILAANPEVNANGGALHLLAKRGDAMGVKWLLDRGAHADALWPHWDAEVTALAIVHIETALEEQVHGLEVAALCCGEEQRGVVRRDFDLKLVGMLIEQRSQALDVAAACGLDELISDGH